MASSFSSYDSSFSSPAKYFWYATIGLAHHLGLAVVAEGVETPGQRDFLAGLACDMCQGFLFSRPLSHSAATAWLLSAAAEA